MIGINLVVRNESARLSVLLPLLRTQIPSAEIVLVDQESIDNTVEISKKYCDKVISDKATGFADTSRRLCMDNTNSAWIITLDADEFLTNRLVVDIPSIIQDDVDGYLIHWAQLEEKAPIENILDFGYTNRYYKHNSHAMKYRIYRKNKVAIGNTLHSGIGPLHFAKTRYLAYNAIVEYKSPEEQEIDLIRYAAVHENRYDSKIHL